MPPKRQPDQGAPKPTSPTGKAEFAARTGEDRRARAGRYSATAPGVLHADTMCKPFTTAVLDAVGRHRARDRAVPAGTA